MFFHMAEYCDTLQSKEKRNREHKACLNERAILCLLDHNVTWSWQCFPAHEEGDLGYSSQFDTVVASFTKAVQFMNFPKSLSAIFIGSAAALCALDRHGPLHAKESPPPHDNVF